MTHAATRFTKKQRLEISRAQLDLERSTFKAHWRDLGDFFLPRRPRFETFDTNRGDRRNQKIIDSTTKLAVRTLRSGMMAGITSPARPWFKLTTPDPGLAKFQPVKEWLDGVTIKMQSLYLKSNLYNVLPIAYGDIGVFGTHSIFVEEDFNDTFRFFPFPIGSYMLANDEKLRVNTFFREFRMTVRQVVEMFGREDMSGKIDWSIFSNHVKAEWDASNYETWVDINHVVQPNLEFNPSRSESKFKRFMSSYYEAGSGQGAGTPSDFLGNDIFLREKGFDFFPVLAPRWEVNSGDVYGIDCPGMTGLGDGKMLQTQQKRKSEAIEKMVRPPMIGPTSLKNQKTSILPGDMTYSDERDGQRGFRPVFEVNFPVGDLKEDIRETQDRINRSFFVDLFLMISQSDRREITATEINAKREEKLLALGPVLEQLNQDLLDPLIDITFNFGLRQGQFEEPPAELEGVELKVEYVSIMAQAQKSLGVGNIERFAGFVGNVAQVDPAAADKVNTLELIDDYGDRLSISPKIIRSNEEAEEIAQQRADAAQAAQRQQAAMDAATTAKDLSQAEVGESNALEELVRQGNAGQLTAAQ